MKLNTITKLALVLLMGVSCIAVGRGGFGGGGHGAVLVVVASAVKVLAVLDIVMVGMVASDFMAVH